MAQGSAKKKKNQGSLNVLRNKALELGAAAAKIIPVDKIVIQDRVILKCKLGCEKYGKTLSCPPHAPTPDQFRKIVSEYHYALFMQFKSKAEVDADLIKYLAKTDDALVPLEAKEKIKKFWLTWNDDRKKVLDTILELEKAAFKEGYLLSAGFISGACQLCEKCNVEGQCIHPQRRRYSEEGVGVDVKATAEKAGLTFTLPFKKTPESYALLLID